MCVLCYSVTYAVCSLTLLALGIASHLVNQLKKVYYICSMWEKYLAAHSQYDLVMGYFMMQQCASILVYHNNVTASRHLVLKCVNHLCIVSLVTSCGYN